MREAQFDLTKVRGERGRDCMEEIFISLEWRHLSGWWELEHFSQQLSPLSLLDWTLLDRGQRTRWQTGKALGDLRLNSVFFPSIFINIDTYYQLSEILIILKYFTRCYVNQNIALVISFVGENSFYRYLNGHKSTSNLLFAIFLHSFRAHYWNN